MNAVRDTTRDEDGGGGLFKNVSSRSNKCNKNEFYFDQKLPYFPTIVKSLT